MAQGLLENRLLFNLSGVYIIADFVDRNSELEKLETSLLPGENRPKPRKEFVLHGPEGAGKTQLAAKFASRHQTAFTATFWVDASSEARIQQSFWRVYRRLVKARMVEDLERFKELGLHTGEATKIVLQWLSKPDNDGWLLVFESVNLINGTGWEDHGAYALERYFPQQDHGAILITSRWSSLAQGWSRLGQKRESLELTPMSDSQGKQMLEKKIGENFPGLDQIVKDLDVVPLALTLAASYIAATGISAPEYLRLYRATRNRLFGDNEEAYPGHYSDLTVVSMLSLTYQEIERTQPSATALLNIFSCLDHSDLSYDLLIPFKARLDTFQFETQASLNELTDKHSFNARIKTLLDFSMIESLEGTSKFSMHPAVHQWCAYTNIPRTDSSLRLAMCIFGCAVSVKRDDKRMNSYRRLLPHSDRLCWLLQKDSHEDIEKQSLVYSLCSPFDSLGEFYMGQRKFQEARAMLQRALERKETALGKDHKSTLDTVYSLALLFSAQNKLDEAEVMYARAVTGYSNVLGNSHPSTLRTFNRLGMLYRKRGEYDKARQIYEFALVMKEMTFGMDHRSTLDTAHGLGSVYMSQQRLDEAEEMLERALDGYERTLGSDHVKTLDTVSDIGSLRLQQGELNLAVEMKQRALRGYIRVLGRDHRSILTTENDLGILYGKQGRHEEAEELLQRVLATYERTSGNSHTSTLGAANNLAFVLYNRGKHAEAELMWERALTGSITARGPDHPTTQMIRNGLQVVQSQKKTRKRDSILKLFGIG